MDEEGGRREKKMTRRKQRKNRCQKTQERRMGEKQSAEGTKRGERKGKEEG